MKRIGVEPPEYLKKLNVHSLSMAQGEDALNWLFDNDYPYIGLGFDIKKHTFLEISWGDSEEGIVDFALWTFGDSAEKCITDCLERLSTFGTFSELQIDKQLLNDTIKKLKECRS